MTTIDRKLKLILDDPDTTPSREDGISVSLERFHRLQGVSLLLSACEILQLDCFPSAATIYHRYYHRVSLLNADVWSSAMASLLLAVKTEEIQCTATQIVPVFEYLYKRHLYFLSDNLSTDERIAIHPTARGLTLAEKKERLKNLEPIRPASPTWYEWQSRLLFRENRILRELGFVLYWISDEQPHRFLVHFLEEFGIDNPSLKQYAWNFCNDSMRLDLCVRYPIEVIACAAIQSACIAMKVRLPTNWWESLVEKGETAQSISNVMNAVQGLSDMPDVTLATKGFARPLDEECFNAEESFVWEMFTGRIEPDDSDTSVA